MRTVPKIVNATWNEDWSRKKETSMSSEETDKIREKLLQIYATRYQKPEWVLNHYVDGLVKEGKTREEAILHLYQKETKEERSSNEVDEIYKKLLAEYAEKGYTDPEGTLELTVKSHVDEGKTREQAILEIWKRERARMPRYEIEQNIEQFRERISRLAVLFSKGEISEESYKDSVKAIEENIDRLRRGEEISTVREPRLPSVSSEYESKWVERGEPSGLWWLVPFFFGIIGGIVAYVGVKDDDEDMASGLLMFGIVWSIILFIIGYVIFFRFI